ncbi:ABC transporter ATP-binding protein [Thiolapillus brandeum]|uniref:ABC transporter ATP-binding protein n=1 Tax=Thiolapillus brandeum TaxID=1076588 RepID=A0A7U6JGK8_9GAMM|nr:ABC transporter ATP-binding protein [Thiolapillus brandeum]BAO43674.1 ABC transporter ATP-binding protein [Thiolapillus brandeum]
MKRYLHEIYYLLGEDRSRLPRMVLLFLALSVLDLASLGLIAPYVSLILDPGSLDGLLAKAVDAAGLPREQETLLVILGVILVGIFLVKAVASILINRNIIRFGFNQQTRLRSYLMKAYQNMPYEQYLGRNSSEYIHSIQQLTNQYANGVVMPLLRMSSDGVVALVIIGFLAWSNFLALVIMVALFGIVAFAYDRMYRKELGTLGRDANDALTKIVRGVNEGIEGLKETRILGNEKYFYDMVREGAEDYARSAIRSQVISTAPRYLLELLLISFIVLLVVLTLMVNGNLQELAPLLALFGVAALRLLPMISLFSNGLLQLRFNRKPVSQLYEDLQQASAASAKPWMESDDVPEDSFESLALDTVSFSYSNMEAHALKDVSIDIHAGEAIGFIGTSGSGKTTLVDVLLGLLTPDKGVIRYNGHLLTDYMASWRRHVAYLPQQVFLIDASVKNNVALGVKDEDIDQQRLQEALRQARLLELVDQLPLGVETLVGERGVRLSGGQRQRIALARAFYHGRGVLVMDEATSALDAETEREIVDEIKRLKGTKTMIIVAHRWTTVQHCDRIYRLERGSVVASGTPEEMLRVS